MKLYVKAATAPVAYNNRQSEVGSTLKTYKGSPIKRSTKYGVGKEIGGDIYFHKRYAERIIPEDILQSAEHVLEQEYPEFNYTCIRYSPKTQVVSFQEAPDFDTAREPKVGHYITIFPDGSVKTGYSPYIFHHKWLFVKNDYPGFDVAESWNWSKLWLSRLSATASGVGAIWAQQLASVGLQ